MKKKLFLALALCLCASPALAWHHASYAHYPPHARHTRSSHR